MCTLKKDDNLFEECGFRKHDIIHLWDDFRKKTKEGKENYLDYVKNEEE